MAQSRLERMIARLVAQRAWLDRAAALIEGTPGIVLEIGLGKGRTWDHLRTILPGRDIYAFDRALHAPAACTPSVDHLFLGDFRDTLPLTRERFGPTAALAHADFGSEEAAHDAEQARWLGPLLDGLMREGGIVIADRPFEVPGWHPLAGSGAGEWPYWGWSIRRSERRAHLLRE
jgi:hypothetical protein